MYSEKTLFDLQKKAIKQKIPKALWLCLKYTETHKEDIIKVGAAWVDNNKFIINTELFSFFIHRKIHTINRNLREHSFRTKKLGHDERNAFFSMLNIKPIKEQSWCLRSHDNFSRNADEKLIDQIPYRSIPKKSIRKRMIEQSQNSQNVSNPDDAFIDGNSGDQTGVCIADLFFNNLDDFDISDFDYSDFTSP
ncbi:hypothetical protein M9Y10_014375 [Tritrichomonas musculus]|uniref:Initiator binding domain-containing protein n=1 Tax=Tritrichomonas musculus TaxID=1915356 RepID=A0ABR2KZC4_9EUKA